MFTGIVQTVAKVFSTNITNERMRLVVEAEQQYAQNINLGASIAINGVCLTVVEVEHIDELVSHISFDVIDETLRVSNLDALKKDSRVNFERSLKVGDEIGGHQVSGHVHANASLLHREQDNENCALTFEIEPQWGKYLFAKGFISINGASLTLGDVENGKFTVHLIPETLARTNLAELPLMGFVNIEMDQQTMTIVDTITRMNLVSK